MQYRVEQLAAAAHVRVDTIRFYQAKGLLPRPRRVGRHAVYTDGHLNRLRRIRRLQREGFPLSVIRRLLGPRTRGTGAALLRALAEERGERTLSRSDLAVEAGVPESLIAAVEDAGIVEPLRVGGRPRYGTLDVEMARAALGILNEGLPLASLLGLALRHAENVRDVVDEAIALFDRHVRRDRSGAERDPAEVVAAFRLLLPAVTALVAHHFQRTLIARAIARLERAGDAAGLRHALAAADAGRLEIAWR